MFDKPNIWNSFGRGDTGMHLIVLCVLHVFYDDSWTSGRNLNSHIIYAFSSVLPLSKLNRTGAHLFQPGQGQQVASFYTSQSNQAFGVKRTSASKSQACLNVFIFILIADLCSDGANQSQGYKEVLSMSPHYLITILHLLCSMIKCEGSASTWNPKWFRDVMLCLYECACTYCTCDVLVSMWW